MCVARRRVLCCARLRDGVRLAAHIITGVHPGLCERNHAERKRWKKSLMISSSITRGMSKHERTSPCWRAAYWRPAENTRPLTPGTTSGGSGSREWLEESVLELRLAWVVWVALFADAFVSLELGPCLRSLEIVRDPLRAYLTCGHDRCWKNGVL